MTICNPKDQSHRKASVFTSRVTKVRLVTTAWVLTEVADAVAVPRYRPIFAQVQSMLVRRNAVVLGPSADLFERGIDLYQRRPDKEWSLTDCISFVAMADRNIAEALTGNHHFAQAGFTALLG